MRKLLALPIVLGILVLLAIGSVFAFRTLVSAPSEDPTEVSLTIEKGEPVAQIAAELEREGLVRNALVYRLFVRFSGFETKIQAGNFVLPKNLSMKDVTYRLTRGTTDQTITTLEGWRIEEIAEYLEKKQVISRDEFLETAGQASLSYDFLPNYVSLDQPYRRLEGYLFPDTYKIAAQSSAEKIIQTMLQNFANRMTPQLRQDLAKVDLTLAEAVNLASIVEREAGGDEDRGIIAGILLKRLQTPGRRLEADATIQFVIGKPEKWWPTLSDSARNIRPDSLYNSYTHDGLPPTPISNPGLASIRAVIYPEVTDFWFYITDGEGRAHFARTIEEHQANVDRYLR